MDDFNKFDEKNDSFFEYDVDDKKKQPGNKKQKPIAGLVIGCAVIALFVIAGLTKIVADRLDFGFDFDFDFKNNGEITTENKDIDTNKFFSIEEATKNDKTSATGKEPITVAEIAKEIGPAVVGVVNQVNANNGFINQTYEQGSGSGIIITKDGYIVTNSHVIEGANGVKINTSDGKEFDAKIIGSDVQTDIAVLKIDAQNLPYAELGDSSLLDVGEIAVAIGNPLGQEFAGSVTVGVISALNRTVTFTDKQLTLIQTDAAINAGNSGGALVNCYGEVVGINTAKISGSGIEGLGFAIPINEAKPIIEDLINNGYVKGRPVFGISCRDITEQLSKAYGLPEGIYVIQVSPFSSAELAGVQSGDIIVKINDINVKTVNEFNNVKNKCKAGETITVGLIRDGKNITVTAVLQEEKPSNGN